MKKKKRCRKQKDKDPFKKLRSRTTVTPLYDAQASFSAAQRIAVRQMGFGSLLTLRFHSFPMKLSYYPLKQLDTSSMEIKLENGNRIEITPKRIREVLGIPMGTKEIKYDGPRADVEEFVHEFKGQFHAVKKMTTTHLSTLIQHMEESDFMFKIRYLMLFSNCMVHCCNSMRLDYYILHNIREGDNIKDFDWCTYIYDIIKSTRPNWKDDIEENWYYGPTLVVMVSISILFNWFFCFNRS